MIDNVHNFVYVRVCVCILVLHVLQSFRVDTSSVRDDTWSRVGIFWSTSSISSAFFGLNFTVPGLS